MIMIITRIDNGYIPLIPEKNKKRVIIHDRKFKIW